jgi:subtilisin family serine protease
MANSNSMKLLNNPLKKSLVLMIAFVLFFTNCNKTETLIETSDVPGLQNFESQPIIGQYIVELSDLSNVKSFKRAPSYSDMIARVKAEILIEFKDINLTPDQLLFVYGSSVVGFAGPLTNEQVEALRKSDKVKHVEQDQMLILKKPSNPGGGKGGDGGDATDPDQTTPWGITRVGGAGDGSDGRVWIIDTGCDMDHNDLNVDGSLSKSFLSGSKANRQPEDKHGHGTHVAGTVAAIDNEIGVVGVAAGATVIAVRVLDARGSGSTSGVISGVDYVAASASAGEVANMSLGGGASTTLDNAVKAAASSGVLFALAAGNESDHANNHSPARANHNNIYTVSAIDINDNFASFSNYGNPPIEFAAPGVSISSLWKSGGYRTISGTSMASPHVAGILVLGSVTTNGYAKNDPDGDADPIAHR